MTDLASPPRGHRPRHLLTALKCAVVVATTLALIALPTVVLALVS